MQVERSKLRPVASGLLTPFKGLCFLGVQLLLGLGILIQLNNYRSVSFVMLLGVINFSLIEPCMIYLRMKSSLCDQYSQ